MIQINRLFSLILSIIICLSMIVSIECAKNKTSLECHKNIMTEIDEHFRGVELIQGDSRFPETFDELRKRCGANKKLIELIGKMADKCMKGFTKNVVQVSVYSLKRARKNICKSKPNREINALLSSGKCVNHGRKQFSQCITRARIHFQVVKDFPSKKRLPFMCCEIIRAKNCLLEKSKDVPQCTDEHIQTLQHHFTQLSQNALDMACGDYNEDSNRCDSIPPPKGLDYSKKPKSIMTTALELIELFDNDPELQV